MVSAARLGVGLGLWRLVPALAATLLLDPAVSSPGRAGSKNGSVTWSGGRGGPVMNPYTGVLWAENLCLWTQDCTAASWTSTNITHTLAQTAPDGTLTACKMAATATAQTRRAQTLTTVTATTYTLSHFFKRGDAAFAVLAVDDGTATTVRKQYFNLATGAVASTVQTGTYVKVSANMIDQALGDGTYRCALTITTPAGTTTRIYVGLADADGTDSLTAAKYATVWGAMFNMGNVATPYYPVMGTALGPPIYTRQAMPGFIVPRVPVVVGSALDIPFRHDFRIGQNLLVNSAWDGAVAGDPGTDPTGWTARDVGAGTLAVPAAGQVTFAATNATDQRGSYQQVTVAASTTYFASARVTAMTGGPLKVSELITWGTIPAGAAVTWYKNGALGDVNTTATVGDTIAALLTVAATAGTGRVHVGAGVTGTTTPASSVTLTEPQCEPGTVRSVYTPTTTAAIASPVCEPVKSTEDGIFCMFHAQGARTNLCPIPMTTFAAVGATATAVADMHGGTRAQRILETADNEAHYATGSAAASVTNGTTYTDEVYAKADGRSVFVLSNSGVTMATFDLAALTATPAANDAYFTGKTATITALWDGWYKCTVTAACIQTTVGTFRCYLQQIGAYVGDITKGMTFYFPQHTAATFPGLPLGEGVALTAQVVTWNLASLPSVVAGEQAVAATPYLWSTPAATAHPSGGEAMWTNSGSPGYFYKAGASTVDVVVKTDGGTQLCSVASPAETSGVVLARSVAYDAVSLRMYRTAALVASDATLSPPWVGRGYINLACHAAGQQWFGAVGVPALFSGRTSTDGERALLATGLARTLSFLA